MPWGSPLDRPRTSGYYSDLVPVGQGGIYVAWQILEGEGKYLVIGQLLVQNP